jgi:L-rhamnose isomerase
LNAAGSIDQAFRLAKERYAELGVDVERALAELRKIPISLHCWQTDDLGGFENTLGLTGGIQATGNYPGKPRSVDEVRQDLNLVLRLLPGRHRLALHAIYGEAQGRKVARDEWGPEHFSRWIDWARRAEIGLDFNPTFFSHEKSADGFTLAHQDAGVRKFWIRHGMACRKIGEAFGRALGTPSVTNVWIPDGYKDTPADRLSPRERLRDALDEIFAEKIDPRFNLDAVESKLFGIGSESYVVGSHEFYLGYAATKGILLTLDAGHYHPTESIADKISSVLLYVPEILLHVSRGVRWDSDHVVTLTDDLRSIAEEIIRAGHERVHCGLDFFDASINRVAAYVIGTRAMLKALLLALLEPSERLRSLEAAGDFTARLALMEELKSYPAGAVWDHYCQQQGVPIGGAWIDVVKNYERDVLARR